VFSYRYASEVTGILWLGLVTSLQQVLAKTVCSVYNVRASLRGEYSHAVLFLGQSDGFVSDFEELHFMFEGVMPLEQDTNTSRRGTGWPSMYLIVKITHGRVTSCRSYEMSYLCTPYH
jgi:hypothetical protein